MSHNNARFSMRNRTGPLRPKADENAVGRHVRQSSVVLAGMPRAAHNLANVNALKNGAQRAALGEVTTVAVNRKEAASKLVGKGKEVLDTGLKHSRSSSLAVSTAGPRIPLGPGRIVTANGAQLSAQTSVTTVLRASKPATTSRQQQRISVHREEIVAVEEDEDEDSDEMEVEDQPSAAGSVSENDSLMTAEEVEVMVDRQAEPELDDESSHPHEKPVRVWPELGTERANRYKHEIDTIREHFQDELDEEDTTMVSEYADEIFEYMTNLEESVMPSPDYMDGQSEINWSMRQTLVDWLLQVHLRYHMLPETLWIAINIVDRFLTKRVVSLVKLQLVGVTAMFIAAKYEEILAPSVDEFVFMTEKGYSKEEILKGERIVLQTLDFQVSHYCSPYSWMRKISKADDYDIQTRTLSKFLTEVTLLDYRFLRVKPSMVAAIGMYTARRMLGGDWVSGVRFLLLHAFHMGDVLLR
ncbi:cyclin-like protein [Cytidiella melzeri]|nr:cyclin-like protein [Cytidiella melzeri]